VCGYRARASVSLPEICRDPWAAAFAGEDGIALSREMDAHFPPGELWIALRTSFLDQGVTQLLDLGTQQVVVLGAGFDARAARLGRPGVRFFEVDHPSTQAEKRKRAEAIPGYPVDAATYVACDFERDDFLERLGASGFVADQPAAIVWEGVVYYLNEPAVRATASRIARGCHPRTALMFDYVGKKLITGATRDQQDLATRAMVAELGEPLKFGLDDYLPLLFEEGFRFVRHTSFDEVCLERTGTYERGRKFRFQHFCIAAGTALPVRW
jgi:methyltransferase (TIGR00027 family)